MADAPARIFNVAVVARNQMNMQMKDRLAGRSASVDGYRTVVDGAKTRRTGPR